MKLTFSLREPGKDKPTPIYGWVHWTADGQHRRFRIITGQSVVPKLWDQRRKRAKKGATAEKGTNAELAKIEADVRKTFGELEALGIPLTVEAVRDRHAVLTGKVKQKPARSLFDDYATFTEVSKENRSYATLQIHHTVIAHLKAFSEAYGVRVTYDTCSSLFFDKFLSYLVNVVGNNNTTAWKIIRSLRVFLRFAVEQDWTTSTDFLRFTGKKMPKGETSDKVYVTVQELEQVKALNLANETRLEVTRDLFMFQAHTGLRYGDVQHVGPEHIAGNELHLVTGKNKKAIRVPLYPIAKTILERYGGRLPRRTNQKQNDYLKELMRLAAITRPVVVVDYRGLQRIERTVDKCDLIGTHTAKRTFVSLLRQYGVSIETICRVTGNSRTTIERYVLKDETDMTAELETVIGLMGE